jgi:uncharacterized protein YciI
MYWLLFYDLVDDYLERRPPLRERHLANVRNAVEKGELVLTGALADPPDAAVLVFRADSAETAERFAQDDPYVAKGLVTNWRVGQWNVVTGDLDV